MGIQIIYAYTNAYIHTIKLMKKDGYKFEEEWWEVCEKAWGEKIEDRNVIKT